MLRKRLAILAVAAGLGLSLGCSGMRTACGTRPGILGRLCGRCKTTTVADPVSVIGSSAAMPPCCNGAPFAAPCGDGPILMDRGGVAPVPGGYLEGNGFGSPSSPCEPTVTPPLGAPPLAGGLVVPPQGRLTPTPQAQPMPFTP